MKKILFFILIIFTSCASHRLYKTGYYTIKHREGSATTFYGVNGKYQLISDTLKQGDEVYMINVTKIR